LERRHKHLFSLFPLSHLLSLIETETAQILCEKQAHAFDSTTSACKALAGFEPATAFVPQANQSFISFIIDTTNDIRHAHDFWPLS
jgi:hypothetical protein